MRGLLLWLAAGQMLGILAVDRGLLGPFAVGPALLCGVALVALLRGARAGLAVALSFAAGVLAAGAPLELAARAQVSRSRDVTLDARVCDVRRSARALGLELCAVREAPALGACPEAQPVAEPAGSLPERLWLSAAWGTAEAAALEPLPPGGWLRARVRVRRLEGLRNPGGSSWALAQRRRGIGGAGALVDPALLVRVEPRDCDAAGLFAAVDPRSALWRLRRRIATRLRAREPGGALLAALAVGDRSGLATGSAEAIRELGLGHLLAVSGLHLAMVMGLGFTLLRAVGVRIGPLARRVDVRAGALVAGALGATAYALLTGFEVPVRRALVFVWVLTLGWLYARLRSPAHVLAAAALIVLAARPEALFEVGAQLSFAASAVLLGARRTADGAGPRWRSGLASSLSTSALAIGATAPLLALHGLSSSPGALLWNLVAVPWTGLVLLPSAIASALLTQLEPAGWAGGLVAAASALAGASLSAAETAASHQPALADLSPVSALGACVGGFLVCVAARTPQLGLRVLLVLAALVWIRSAPAASLGPPPPRVVALDVGQGDSILVQGRRGALLVDGGRAVPGGYDLGRSAVLPALRALGVTRLDAVVASHADLDHRGGLAHLLRQLPVGALWLPAGSEQDAGLDTLIGVAERQGVPLRALAAGDAPFEVGDLRIEPLWPPRTGHAQRESRNDRSLVLRVRFGRDRVLLTGDIGADVERALLASGAEVDAEVLKLPHHGSRTSSTGDFIAAVGARFLLLSAPCGARSGLPDAAVLKRVSAGAGQLGWTGRDGALIVSSPEPGDGLRLTQWAPSRICAPPARPPPPPIGLCPLGRDD